MQYLYTETCIPTFMSPASQIMAQARLAAPHRGLTRRSALAHDEALDKPHRWGANAGKCCLLRAHIPNPMENVQMQQLAKAPGLLKRPQSWLTAARPAQQHGFACLAEGRRARLQPGAGSRVFYSTLCFRTGRRTRCSWPGPRRSPGWTQRRLRGARSVTDRPRPEPASAYGTSPRQSQRQSVGWPTWSRHGALAAAGPVQQATCGSAACPRAPWAGPRRGVGRAAVKQQTCTWATHFRQEYHSACRSAPATAIRL